MNIFHLSYRNFLYKLILITLCCLFVFSARTFAASADVEALLSQLSALQNSDIDPAWLPDIEANEALVEALLQDYESLSRTEKEELTTSQMQDLRAYFVALYEVQGRDEDDLNALLEEESTSDTAAPAISVSTSSTSTPSSSEVETASSSVNNTTPSAQSEIQPQSEETRTSSSASASLAVVETTTQNNTTPPLFSLSFLQSFSNESPYAFFASVTFGQSLFFISIALILLLIIRFAVSIVTLGPPPGSLRYKRKEQKKQRKIAQNEEEEILETFGTFDVDAPLPPDTPLITVKDEFPTQDMEAIDRLIATTEEKATPKPMPPIENPIVPSIPPGVVLPQPSAPTASHEKSREKTSPALPKLGDARTGRPTRMPFSQGDAFDLDAIDD